MEKKRIVVLGAGESGAGAAVLAQVKGFEVFVSDMSTIKAEYKQLLDNHAIAWEEEKHTQEKILNADEVIKSPGISDKSPLIKKLKDAGIPIISEIEFAGRYTTAKMICITGSNGKTTTTMLTYHILLNAGLNVGLAGNVGRSLALQVALEDYDYYVVELSSFQLDNMYEFKADLAILLNITPDHLDRYDYNFQNYVDAKFRIIQNQTSDDAFIFWSDDPVIARELESHHIVARSFPFAAEKGSCNAAYLSDNQLIVDATDREELQFSVEQQALSLQGPHNMLNTMAASISARLLEINDEALRVALSNFQGVEHRLEKVARVRGVQYINDSKATNVNSCWYALMSMHTPVILIFGGTDKGNDYSEIDQLVQEKCKALIYLGVDNAKLHNYFDEKVAITVDARSMQEAIEAAYRLAQPGDTVLLSPCCASFDLFKNYEDRGRQFKQIVKSL